MNKSTKILAAVGVVAAVVAVIFVLNNKTVKSEVSSMIPNDYVNDLGGHGHSH